MTINLDEWITEADRIARLAKTCQMALELVQINEKTNNDLALTYLRATAQTLKSVEDRSGELSLTLFEELEHLSQVAMQ